MKQDSTLNYEATVEALSEFKFQTKIYVCMLSSSEPRIYVQNGNTFSLINQASTLNELVFAIKNLLWSHKKMFKCLT